MGSGIGVKGYALQILHHPLGDGKSRAELVYALGENERAAEHLVRVALRLSDEVVKVVGDLTDEEVRRLGLKQFDVRHARDSES